MKIRVGSRESVLAVRQAEIVMEYIKSIYPDMELELVTMKTTGDIIQDRTLDKIGGKGLFVKELDQALIENRVDITVHSMKDMPMELPKGLPIIAVSDREDCRDALVLPKGVEDIDFTKPIGCSSKRRTLQLKKIYPNCIVEPIRGNVLTRLEKLDKGDFSAIVLASAGLRRINLENRISRFFTPEEMIPASCQGTLAVQSRDDFNKDILKGFGSKESWDIAMAERSFVCALDGGCSSPVAAYGRLIEDKLYLTGMYVDEEEQMIEKTIICNREEGCLCARSLAFELRGDVGRKECCCDV
ncbi:MAG: hydroxymethylbilane synthase [Filifactoraceae bacterium]